MTVRWQLEDIGTAETYDLAFNPNEGGSAVPGKSMNIEVMVSPNVNGILQQGPWDELSLEFSGVILTQAQDEAMERWAMRKTRLKLTDDLGRVFTGRLISFARDRVRRGNNPWYSKYQASFVAAEHVYGNQVVSTEVTPAASEEISATVGA